MSLIAWYPLNGSLKNLGVGDMDFAETYTPTYTLSKFGLGYYGNATTYWTESQTALVLNNNALSICFWVKPLNSNSHSSTYSSHMFFGNSNMSVNNNRKFAIFSYPNNLSVHLSWQNDSTTQIVGENYSNIFTVNTWSHFCITYDNPTVTVYLNGNVYKTFEFDSTSSTFAYKTRVFTSSSDRILNDYRFYDHCLSPKEVKEISKGLILHYPLNQIDGYIGGRNLITNSLSAPNGFNDCTGKASVRFITDSETVSGKAYEITFPSDSNTYNNYNLYTRFNRNASAVQKDGKTYTLSFKAKASVAINSYTFYYEYTYASISVNLTTSWQTYSMTASANGTYSALYVCMGQANRAKINGNKLYISDLKLELGNSNTTYTPAPEEINYDNIICDCSGFGNNGSYSDGVVSDSDTPIGQCSTLLAGTTVDTSSNTLTGAKYIQGKCVMNSSNAITVSWWGKINKYGRGGIFDTTSSTSDYYASYDYDSGTPISNWDGVFRFKTSTGQSIGFDSNIIKADSAWHLNTITYDGSTAKCYVDGELKQSGSITGSLKTFNGIKMGIGRAGGVWRQINLNVSDVRIYATALSADDVKELYQTRFLIANNGTLFCTEYVDNEGVKFNKTGVLNSSLLYEDVYTYDMPTKTLSDGSKWARIFYHNNRSGTKYFNKTDDFANSAIIHDDDRYSRLNVLSEYQYNGVYELMACLPDDGNGVWRWTLTNNPVTSTTAGTVSSVTGYNYDSLGLMQCTSNTYLAHSTSGGNWWCAVGCWTKYNGGIPGWGGVIVKGGLELWVRIYNTEDKTSVYKDAVTTRELIEY